MPNKPTARELLKATAGGLEDWENAVWLDCFWKKSRCKLCRETKALIHFFSNCGVCPLSIVGHECYKGGDSDAMELADRGNKEPILAALRKALAYQTHVVFQEECEAFVREALE